MTKDEAIKLALEALENHSGNYKLSKSECVTHNAAIDALREALAEQPAQQEPVAWVRLESWVTGKYWPDDCFSALPIDEWRPLYTSPPQRTWVGLTDKEEVELWESTDSDWELMKRTEAKLKEKNS